MEKLFKNPGKLLDVPSTVHNITVRLLYSDTFSQCNHLSPFISHNQYHQVSEDKTIASLLKYYGTGV